MNYTTKVELNVNNEIWIKNLKKTNSSTGYQLPLWLEIYQKSFNSIPIFISIKNQENKIVGQLSCIIHNEYNWNEMSNLIKSIGTKFNLNSILTWSYGPIIYDKQNQEKILSEILNKLEEIIKNYNVTTIRGFTNPNFKFNKSIFTKFNYVLQPWSTYQLKLDTDSKNLFSNLNKKIRYDIKQSEKKELTFQVVDNKKLFDDFANFVIKTKIQNGEARKLNKIFFNTLWELGFKNQIHQVFLVKKDEKIISAADFLIFNNTAIQIGVVNSSNKQYSGGTFLTWNAIKWANDHNLGLFDFGGANPVPKTNKEKQINFYKSKWNTEKAEYFFVTKYISKNKSKISSGLKRVNIFMNKINKNF